MELQGVFLVLSKVICFGSSFILHPGPYGGCHFFTETGRFCYTVLEKFIITFKNLMLGSPNFEKYMGNCNT